MTRFAFGLFGLLLLGGCADSVKEAETVTGKSPVGNVPVATEKPSARTTVAESVPGAAEVASAVDAERLLASTLASAKADNKRVMVHVGAPW